MTGVTPMSDPEMRALDRHALTTTIWLCCGFVAAACFSYGFGAGGVLFVACGFTVILAGFIAHIIVNAVHDAYFTSRELALGLIAYAVALVSFGLALLLSQDFARRQFLPVSLGLIIVPATVLFYMIVHFGVRRTFESFDVIRRFNRSNRSES
jgi:hypothetical protein